MNFTERLKGPPILFDGGMGTELYFRGVYVNQCYDEINRTQPDLVKAIHADYLSAGAEVIETNTFGANRYKLDSHGLAADTADLNIRSAELARAAVENSGSKAYVSGAIGPLGKRQAPLGTIEPSDVRAAFKEQAESLIEGGVDLISIETMIEVVELEQAVQAVREVSDIPIVAQISISNWYLDTQGPLLDLMVELLEKYNVNAVGVNCSIGPSKLLEAAKYLVQQTDLPVIVQPNAGELEWVDGRLICRATPEYFAEYTKRLILSGVKLVGGCCGSTPAHIRAMNAALRAIVPELSKVKITARKITAVKDGAAKPETPYRERSQMAADLEDGKFVYSVELNPPRSTAVRRILSKCNELKNNGVILVNIPDGPRASARLSNLVIASEVQKQVGIEAIIHYTCRDRNILGIQSELLGAEVLGIDNVLCVTGDPPKLGDYPMATAVFDVDAIGLLRIADNLNHGMDLAGNPIVKGTDFHLGCGVNPGAVDLTLEINRLHQKIENGARYILTQPVFEEELFLKFIKRADVGKIPILVGILPLASFRNAEFFHNEVPGMEVPEHIRERLRPISDKEKAMETGVEIAAEALSKTAPYASGAYIMPPFGRIELALGVIDQFKNSN